jgi:hypothetical protein
MPVTEWQGDGPQALKSLDGEVALLGLREWVSRTGDAEELRDGETRLVEILAALREKASALEA